MTCLTIIFARAETDFENTKRKIATQNDSTEIRSRGSALIPIEILPQSSICFVLMWCISRIVHDQYVSLSKLYF